MGRGASFLENELINTIKPQLVDNATVNSGWLPVTGCTRLVAIVIVGVTDTTVDAKLQQATDSSGTGAKDITGAALVQVAGTGDNKTYAIDLETNHLDGADGNFNHVQLSVTAGDGTAGAYVAAMVVRHMNLARPVTQPAEMAQKVVVAG